MLYNSGMPNHLAAETSPYLLQHADNPVEWYPWGGAALERARAEDKPILLSIGYAACHWCHVMAHESFEDEATAVVMNSHFINIKVDREERPDLDSVYMQAVQAMTGQGGWPMTVFLTPDGTPFYGGTYFPPTDRQGMPSFTKVLQAVADAYQNRRESIVQSASTMQEIYRSAASTTPTAEALTPHQLELAYRSVAQRYDIPRGGFGDAPKFPPTMLLDFLLRHWARTGTQEAREMAHQTFVKMAHGGIYDQIGGGIARYAVDASWLVPHFEKMLYDNAQLIRFGAHLYQATHDEEVRRITEETVLWLSREMISPAGGFYSSLDADSEGKEGKFYLWSEAELDQVLGADAPLIKAYYGVSTAGNFDGENILFIPSDARLIAARASVSPEQLMNTVHRARTTLYTARSARIWPGRDEKILAGWNGLAVRGIADAARIFGRDDFSQLAQRTGTFLATEMVQHGRVMRVHKDGVTRIPGFLEDQAAVALGFLALFEHTLDPKWITLARELTDTSLDCFWDDASGVLYDTARDAEPLIIRPRDITDNALPSGTSLMMELLFRLAAYFDHEPYRIRAQTVLASLTAIAVQHPMAFGHTLSTAEYAMTFTCHVDYCDLPSPRALDVARALSF
jgi:uncharacterized protein